MYVYYSLLLMMYPHGGCHRWSSNAARTRLVEVRSTTRVKHAGGPTSALSGQLTIIMNIMILVITGYR